LQSIVSDEVDDVQSRRAASNRRNKKKRHGNKEDKEANTVSSDGNKKSKGGKQNGNGGGGSQSNGNGGNNKSPFCKICNRRTDHKTEDCPNGKASSSPAPFTAAGIHKHYKSMEKTANHVDSRRIRFLDPPSREYEDDDDEVICSMCQAEPISSDEEHDRRSDTDDDVQDADDTSPSSEVPPPSSIAEVVSELVSSAVSSPGTFVDIGNAFITGDELLSSETRTMLALPVQSDSNFILDIAADQESFALRNDRNMRALGRYLGNVIALGVVDDCASCVESAMGAIEPTLSDWLVRLLRSLTLTFIHANNSNDDCDDCCDEYLDVDPEVIQAFYASDLTSVVSVSTAELFASVEQAVMDSETLRASPPLVQAGVANVFLLLGQHLASVNEDVRLFLQEMHVALLQHAVQQSILVS